MPKVTIILPSYNHASFLEDRLNTIVGQTFTDWELIIIDDKSSDRSQQILSHFVANNVDKVKHFIVNETNSGSGYFSWKKGIQLAQSEYIWVAETDDYSELNFLEEQVTLLEKNKNCALAFCASVYVDSNKNYCSDSLKRTQDLYVSSNEYKVITGDFFIEKMPLNTYITNGSSVVFRKPTQVIPDEIFNHRQCSDIFFWTFLLQNSYFIFNNKKLNYFRRHDDSTTTKIASTKALMGTYKELIAYLDFFNCPNKSKKLIEHYFNNYIWRNKTDVLNLNVFGNNNILKKMYLKMLFSLIKKKIFNDK
jgi:glycosyltransferase involved in cell wall biosynthesis